MQDGPHCNDMSNQGDFPRKAGQAAANAAFNPTSNAPFEMTPGRPLGPGGPQSGPPAGAQGAVPGAQPGFPGFAPDGGQGAPPAEDPVSGALNVPGFGVGFARTLASGQVQDLALWYIDIRNFRSLNPNYGFLMGNYALKTLVAGIRKYITNDLPVARLGADRFILLSCNLPFDKANEAFGELLQWLSGELVKEGINYRMPLAAGIYYLRKSDFEMRDFKKALDYASIAHRNARREAGSALVQFTDEDLERDRRRIIIEQSFDDALEAGKIEVWYQPQIDYYYGEVIGAEALARWKHEELGWISPQEFVPVLERCGKVHALDLYVWEEACRSAGKWRVAADGAPVPISVNVSRMEMFETGLTEHFISLQDKYDLPEGSLHLEITESAFVEEAGRLNSIIEEMRANKLRIEMDDFGSGLSSLNMLKDVQVDVVKLDMGFMRTAVNEERGGVVLSSVIRMLQGLDTPIIAEGVETLEQAEMLKNMGCHLMQGFHFSRPMPLNEFESFLASNNPVEFDERRVRKDSNIEDLMSFDPASSILFNDAVGGMILFLIEGENTESILVNDAFYEECGLSRAEFGDKKVNLMNEIDSASRETMWRAAAEAREKGSAHCTMQVRITGRWLECIMRFLSTSVRGDVYSLSIYRSGSLLDKDSHLMQISQDAGWNLDLLREVVPSGFLKCVVNDNLTINYLSSNVVASSGLSREEYHRRYHNSFLNSVAASDRTAVLKAVRAADDLDEMIDIEFNMLSAYNKEVSVQMLGRVRKDDDGTKWLYALLMMKSDEEVGKRAELPEENTISFEYYIADDSFDIHIPTADGTMVDSHFSNWLQVIDSLPETVDTASATKILATVQDLKHHPISGFSDLKCDFRNTGTMRWYHINYTCDSDDEGNATVIHGYAQDATDQMGSAKWWRRQAERDYLTGLLNRNSVEQKINMSMRIEGQGAMFMIDLDDFKHVNDDLGHLTGDTLLRDISAVLSSHFRESDVLGRYGGDEFVAFMPVTMGDVRAIAEKRAADIVRDISQVEIPNGKHAACSVGVAICKDRNATFYDLIEYADQAMYTSKTSGKSVYTLLEME